MQTAKQFIDGLRRPKTVRVHRYTDESGIPETRGEMRRRVHRERKKSRKEIVAQHNYHFKREEHEVFDHAKERRSKHHA